MLRKIREVVYKLMTTSKKPEGMVIFNLCGYSTYSSFQRNPIRENNDTETNIKENKETF